VSLTAPQASRLREHGQGCLAAEVRAVGAHDAAAPKTTDMLSLVKEAIETFGKPRFLVTDHGGQFQKQFKKAIERRGIAHVQGPPRRPQFDGKVERFFRTLKLWQRMAMLFLGPSSVQLRLDGFRTWYNQERCHQSLNGLTPEEVWTKTKRAAPLRYLARANVQPVFHVRRGNHANDPNLPIFDIQITRVRKAA
jgi:hypothetical protein